MPFSFIFKFGIFGVLAGLMGAVSSIVAAIGLFFIIGNYTNIADTSVSQGVWLLIAAGVAYVIAGILAFTGFFLASKDLMNS